MKKNILIINILLFFFNIQNIALANIKNKIIVKIENEVITDYEIRNKIFTLLILANEDINQKNIDKIKKNALDSLIQHKLKKIELLKFNISNNPNQVNSYLQNISSNNIEGLKKTFIDYKLDYQFFLDEIETQLKWQRLIFQIYKNKIDIDETSLNKELEDISQKVLTIKEFRIFEIEIALNNDKFDNEKILNIQNLINEKGFDSIALKYSISSSASDKGDLGWVKSESLTRPIYDIISGLKKGEISKPFLRENSAIFFKLEDKRISKTKKINLTEMKKNLLDKKKNELFDLYSSSHISKIKNSSLIEFK